MKFFLDYLFYKYYWLQHKVGNGDVAPFMSMLIISFTFMLYYFSIFFIVILIFPYLIISMQIFKFLSLSLFFLFIFLFYYLFLYKEKYKVIIKEKTCKYKSNLGSIFFPLFAFILFNLGWILKMLQNQGKI